MSQPLFGAFPRGACDAHAEGVALGNLAEGDAYRMLFPAWCKPVPGREPPWFRVGGAVYWGSVGYDCGTCRVWIDEGKSRIAASAPNWRLLKMRLASLHGVAVGAIDIRPNLPVWVK